LALREQVARALVNKGWNARQLKRSEEAIVVYNEMVQRFKGAAELPLLELTSRALLAQAELFKDLNQRERRLSVCSEILRNFENRSEEALQECVREARELMDEGHTEGLRSAATS